MCKCKLHILEENDFYCFIRHYFKFILFFFRYSCARIHTQVNECSKAHLSHNMTLMGKKIKQCRFIFALCYPSDNFNKLNSFMHLVRELPVPRQLYLYLISVLDQIMSSIVLCYRVVYLWKLVLIFDVEL